MIAVNWTNYTFGSYSYAKFATAVESAYCQLRKVVMTTLTLRSLSEYLCYHLGAVMKSNRIRVEVWHHESPWSIWKQLKLNKTKVTVGEFKRALRHNMPLVQHKHPKAFDKVFADLDYFYKVCVHSIRIRIIFGIYL